MADRTVTVAAEIATLRQELAAAEARIQEMGRRTSTLDDLRERLAALYQLIFHPLRTAIATNESDLARAPCGDLTRVGGIPGMALRQYAGRHDRHAGDSAKMAVRRLEAR